MEVAFKTVFTKIVDNWRCEVEVFFIILTFPAFKGTVLRDLKKNIFLAIFNILSTLLRTGSDCVGCELNSGYHSPGSQSRRGVMWTNFS